MKMNKVFAAMAASVVAASAFAAMSMNSFAAEKTIAYTASEGSLGVGDDGTSVRRNIYNVWGNDVKDIDGATAVNGYVTVTFEVVGIGEDVGPKDDDGNVTGQYQVFLGGSIAGQNRHANEYNNGDIPADEIVDINGDGTYSVTWNLEWGSENIDCLYLQSNISCYSYGDFQGLETSGVSLNVTSIKTDDGVEEDPTETTTTTTGANGGSTTTTTTTTAAKGTTTTAAKTGEGSAKTGDAGVAVAVAALGVAAATAFVVRKKD